MKRHDRSAVALCLMLCASAAIFGTLAGRPAPSLGPEEVRILLLETILPQLSLPEAYVAYLYEEVLQSGDDLAPYRPQDVAGADSDASSYRIRSRSWFSWVDLDPCAKYAHPVLFLLIDDADGTFTVHEEMWWPLVNGSSLATEDGTTADRTVAIDATYADCGTGKAPPEGAFGADWIGGDPFDWVLLVNGWSPGEPGRDAFATDLAVVRDAVAGLGMRVTTLDVGEASPAALEDEIERLFTEIPLYKCCDRLYVYITCHASRETLWIGGEPLGAQELARILTLPGTTYVPSRVYVLLDAGYGGSFIPALAPHGNITRVWAASSADEPAYGDLDTDRDPDRADGGSEWTSAFVAALADVLATDPFAAEAVDRGRFYMTINAAMEASASWDAAALDGATHPARYLVTDKDSQALCECVEYLGAWDRELHRNAGRLEETIASPEETPCGVFFDFLYGMARHDALLPPSTAFNQRRGKGCARDVAHSDWKDLCALYWETFTRTDGDGGASP